MTAPDMTEGATPRSRDSLALRIASAAVLAPAAVATSYVGGPVFAALVAFLCVLMSFEWARMIERSEMSPVFYALGLGGSAALILAAAGRYEWAFIACAASGVAAATASMRRSRNWAWAAFGAAYFLAPSAALIWLRENAEDGRGLLMLLFAIVWSADTGGYVAGRFVGGPKLSPKLSPAKTWAGAVGGLLFGAVAASIGAPLVFDEPPGWTHILIGGGLGLASILGDMAESAFKRRFGIKDMSGFIPGHGGVLDRLDGMIFATTAVTAVLYAHKVAAGLSG